MTSEIIFVNAYACPRCRAELEVPRGYESMWLACPKCGRASLPPSTAAPIRRSRPIDEDVLIIGPEDDVPLVPLPQARPPKQSISARRVFLLFGFVISFCGLAEGMLSQNSMRAAIFGAATLVFVGLMTYPTKPGHE